MLLLLSMRIVVSLVEEGWVEQVFQCRRFSFLPHLGQVTFFRQISKRRRSYEGVAG